MAKFVPKSKLNKSPTPVAEEVGIAGAEQPLDEDMHVVHKGEKVREATDEEKLSRSIEVPVDVAAPEEAVVSVKLEEYVTKITNLKNTPARWNQISVFQRYALLGARAMAQEVLGQADDNGVKIRLSKFLGIDPKTGNTAGA